MGEVSVEQSEETNGENKSCDAEKDVTLDELIHERIIQQLEYYFSDVNLSRDKFMQQQIKLDDGWLPIELLMKFKRLADIVGERDKSVIVEALRASNLLEVSAECDKIRRSAEHPLPEGFDELRGQLMKRTIYCKGFPLEGITFDEIFEYFKSFGKIDSVIMRHYMDKATKKRGFKGSAFVTFPTVEAADEFLKQEVVKYKDTPLIKMWQNDYIDNKRKERLEDKLKHQQRRRENKRSGNKKESEKDEKRKKGEEEERSGFALGTVVHFTGIGEESKIHRDMIRQAVESAGHSVAFIDFSMGDLSGYVRLEHSNTGKELVDKLKEESEGKLKLGEESVEVRVLEGEEEANYLDRARKEMNKRRQNCKSKKGRRGRGGNFNDRGRKRKGGFVDGAPPSKAQARD